MSKPKWKITDLIKSLGGVQRLPQRFRDVGIDPPILSTMVGWRRRNSAPSEWTLALLVLAANDPDMPPLKDLLELMWDGE